MGKLGNSLGTSVNHYNRAHKELTLMDKDVLRISGEAPGIESLVIDKPQKEE
jgi:DNA recombination protein RmuC